MMGDWSACSRPGAQDHKTETKAPARVEIGEWETVCATTYVPHIDLCDVAMGLS